MLGLRDKETHYDIQQPSARRHHWFDKINRKHFHFEILHIMFAHDTKCSLRLMHHD